MAGGEDKYNMKMSLQTPGDAKWQIINMTRIFLWVALVASACNKESKKEDYIAMPAGSVQNVNEIDHDFIATLSTAGIFDAARKIGLDVNKYILPLATQTNHSYRRYRWSVGYHENGGIMISALPPEEELGWTPWERWYKDDKGVVRKESWVMYPLTDNIANGVSHWYTLDENELEPRYMKNSESLREQLRRARIYEAAALLNFDVDEMLLRPLSPNAVAYYQQCRWVVVPHILGGDGPVIYILPPMSHSDEWPWESWYTDGKVKLIHHVHYTKANERTTGSWKEFLNAPQRPPEIFGVEWYWYDDHELIPTMHKFKY